MQNPEDEHIENTPSNIEPPVSTPLNQIPTTSEQPTNSLPKPPKKKRSTLAITTAFLAGAMTYAIFAAGYNLYVQSLKQASEIETNSTNTSQTAQATPEPEETIQSVKEDDFKNYVQATDCTTKSAYSAYQQMFALGTVSYINLYDGATVSVVSPNSTRTYKVVWKTLPEIVDYKCEKISITDIKENDRVNVYADKGATVKAPATIEDTRIIQKATK